MKIGIVIWELKVNFGGLERVGLELATAMTKRGHKVIIYYRDILNIHDTLICRVNDIEYMNLTLTNGDQIEIEKNKELIIKSNIDVLIAMFSWRDLMWFPKLLHNTGIPLIVSEHNFAPIIEHERWNPLEHRACLAAADSIHILLDSFKNNYPLFLHDRINVIHNPVPDTNLRADAAGGKTNSKVILAAGRFVESHKQFSLLIQAFALLASKFPNWHLKICGNGPDMLFYIQLIQRLSLSERVTLPGFITDVSIEYSKSQLFCIPSKYEGFGLVTVEAQRQGLPVIGFEQCPGTNELIINGSNGLLAEEMTPISLAKSLQILMANASLRIKMGKNGLEFAKKFDPEPIYDKWEQLIKTTAKVKGQTRLNIEVNKSEESRAYTMLLNILQRNQTFYPFS